MKKVKLSGILFLVFFLAASLFYCAPKKQEQKVQEKEKTIKHVEVYYEKDRFGGWPANFGAWSWGDELLVGFAQGYYKNLGEERHNIDREKPEVHLFTRSKDGGETWEIEDPSADGILVARGTGLHGVEPKFAKSHKQKILISFYIHRENLSLIVYITKSLFILYGLHYCQ